MATASMLTLTLHWQDEISRCTREISNITYQRQGLLNQTTRLSEEKQDELSQISQDDPEYYAETKKIKDYYKTKEREIEMLEEEMDLQLSTWNTRKSMAEQYKNSYQAELQNDAKSEFAPFPAS